MTWINSSGLPNAHNDAYGSGSPRHGGERAYRQYGHENVWRWLVRIIMKYIWQMVISQTTTIDLRNRKPLVFCWGNIFDRVIEQISIGTTIYLSLIALEISSCCSCCCWGNRAKLCRLHTLTYTTVNHRINQSCNYDFFLSSSFAFSGENNMYKVSTYLCIW